MTHGAGDASWCSFQQMVCHGQDYMWYYFHTSIRLPKGKHSLIWGVQRERPDIQPCSLISG